MVTFSAKTAPSVSGPWSMRSSEAARLIISKLGDGFSRSSVQPSGGDPAISSPVSGTCSISMK